MIWQINNTHGVRGGGGVDGWSFLKSVLSSQVCTMPCLQNLNFHTEELDLVYNHYAVVNRLWWQLYKSLKKNCGGGHAPRPLAMFWQ